MTEGNVTTSDSYHIRGRVSQYHPRASLKALPVPIDPEFRQLWSSNSVILSLNCDGSVMCNRYRVCYTRYSEHHIWKTVPGFAKHCIAM